MPHPNAAGEPPRVVVVFLRLPLLLLSSLEYEALLSMRFLTWATSPRMVVDRRTGGAGTKAATADATRTTWRMTAAECLVILKVWSDDPVWPTRVMTILDLANRERGGGASCLGLVLVFSRWEWERVGACVRLVLICDAPRRRMDFT